MAQPETFPLGTIPEIGVIPKKMHAWVIRKERHGEPLKSFQKELVPPPEPGPREVMLLVLAAGVNFNGVWAGLGKPVSVLDVHGKPYHIAGSDASGLVWKVGSEVRGWKPGDEVVVHCNQYCQRNCGECPTFDPMACQEQKIWGYETPDGSFAQFTVVQEEQVLRKPAHLTWEEAACYGLTYFTAFRMLTTRAQLKPGETVLVWGGAGGLGTMAIQLINQLGGKAVAVVSSEEKAKLCMELGAVGTINRKNFPNLAWRPNETPEQTAARIKDTKAFGRAIWEILGNRVSPDIVFEHVGSDTFPTSVFLCRRFGRIVICGATSGFTLQFDVRHLWMHQKSILGSHFANHLECKQANELVHQKKIRPVLSSTWTFDQVAQVHQEMYENKHSGNMAVLVQAPRQGCRTAEEVRAAGG